MILVSKISWDCFNCNIPSHAQSFVLQFLRVYFWGLGGCANTKFSHKISDHTGGGNASSNPLFRSNVKVLMEFVLVMPNELIVILWPLFFLKNVTAIHNGNNVDILEFELINWKLFNLLNHFKPWTIRTLDSFWTF